MIEGFFIVDDPMEIRKAVLAIASYSQGGISEWVDMCSGEFILWLDALRDMQRDGGK